MECQDKHRRYFQIAGITVCLVSDLDFNEVKFKEEFAPFAVAGPGEDNVTLRHYFELPDLNGKDLGKELYRKVLNISLTYKSVLLILPVKKQCLIKIKKPLIGDMQAAGLTVPQLDWQISEKLKEFVKFPEVSISIKKIGGSKIIVLGEVNKPGIYSVSGKRTVLNV